MNQKSFAEKIRETAPESANRILDSVKRFNTAIEQGDPSERVN